MAGPRLMDEVRSLMRRFHYSIHTERCYCDWITRFVRFHRMQSRDELLRAGSPEVEVFLTHLAEDGKVAAATQNQAMNALVFLYKRVLERPLEGRIDAARSSKKVSIFYFPIAALTVPLSRETVDEHFLSATPPHGLSPRSGFVQQGAASDKISLRSIFPLSAALAVRKRSHESKNRRSRSR